MITLLVRIDKNLFDNQELDMYQSAFVFLSFLVMIILVVYQNMTKQYLLRTTIQTNVQMFNLLETNAYDVVSIGNSNGESMPKTENKSAGNSALLEQNSSIVEPTATDGLLTITDVEAERRNVYLNKSINNITINEYKSKSEVERTNISLHETGDESFELSRVKDARINGSTSIYDAKLAKEDNLFYRNNVSKEEDEQGNEMIAHIHSVDETENETSKVVKTYGRHRYNISKTKNGNSNISAKSDCQRFLYENLNNNFNDTVLETLKKKCSESKKTKFCLDKLFLSKVIENITCPATKMKYSTKKLPLVALASFPGSGNTWTRVLIESVTGIHTGSLYKDSKSNFPGSKVCPTNSGVYVVKTHRTSDHVERTNCRSSRFQKAIFILRNPYDAIIAEFNRLNGGKVGFASKNDFHSNRWRTFILSISNRWKKTALYWMSTYKKPLYVLSYERLQTNTIFEMYKVMKFLNRDITLKTLYCLVNKPRDEYHRGTKPDWMVKSKLFGDKAISYINGCINFVSQRIFQKSFKQTFRSYLLHLP